nr:unnamed protein product [Callosobruchus chinensis]
MPPTTLILLPATSTCSRNGSNTWVDDASVQMKR